jgi:hypothetical protein
LGFSRPEQGAAERELFFALAVGEEAVVTHAAELRWGDVSQEAADEFFGPQAHDFLDRLAFLAVV